MWPNLYLEEIKQKKKQQAINLNITHEAQGNFLFTPSRDASIFFYCILFSLICSASLKCARNGRLIAIIKQSLWCAAEKESLIFYRKIITIKMSLFCSTHKIYTQIYSYADLSTIDLILINWHLSLWRAHF